MRVIPKERKKKRKTQQELKRPYWSLANILRTKETETEKQVRSEVRLKRF